MTPPDLFTWAAEAERARLQRAAATVVSFEAELLKRRSHERRWASYVEHERRQLARAAGAMEPCPILPLRRRA